MRLRWTPFVLILLCAAMAFGGTFTCRGSSGGGHHHDDEPPANTP